MVVGILDRWGGGMPGHRSRLNCRCERRAPPVVSRFLAAAVAQSVERVLGKDEVMGSNPISSFIS